LDEFSPFAMSHWPSPHTAPVVQSLGQVAPVSPFSHWPLPHTGVMAPPQSATHWPTSEGEHKPSPQIAGLLFVGASGVGAGSSPPPAHALRAAENTNATIDVLIAAHRCRTRVRRSTTKFNPPRKLGALSEAVQPASAP
jgi:hypothetical protein